MRLAWQLPLACKKQWGEVKYNRPACLPPHLCSARPQARIERERQAEARARREQQQREKAERERADRERAER